MIASLWSILSRHTRGNSTWALPLKACLQMGPPEGGIHSCNDLFFFLFSFFEFFYAPNRPIIHKAI